MFLYLNPHHIACNDHTVHCLSWMRHGDQFNADNIDSGDHGWLATGNSDGLVGATYTCTEHSQPRPHRSNYNLRGHKSISKVELVRWNEPFQRLATCDSHGVIFVWVYHDRRWSIELINDRNCLVEDFNWANSGKMAVICYQDGFILCGSVMGQRNWSTTVDLRKGCLTCGIWNKDDTKVLLSTSHGEIIELSALSGAFLSRVTIDTAAEITGLLCGRHVEDDKRSSRFYRQSHVPSEKYTVAVKSGQVYVDCDELHPTVANTGLSGIRMAWSSDHSYLAVVGYMRRANLACSNYVKIITPDGHCRVTQHIPNQTSAVTDVVWGHKDQRLFISAGQHIYPYIFGNEIASLQNLSQLVVYSRLLTGADDVTKLPLPIKIQTDIGSHFNSTIRTYLPERGLLLEYVCQPPPSNERVFCTMKRQYDDSSFVLYVEHLGGHKTILHGQRTSKLRPEFVIYNPQHDNWRQCECDSDDSVPSESKKSKKDACTTTQRLVEVTSNIWGTRFKIVGVAKFLPDDLGYILYKTSLLHLQPRQMSIAVTNLEESKEQIDCNKVDCPSVEGYMSLSEMSREDNLTMREDTQDKSIECISTNLAPVSMLDLAQEDDGGKKGAIPKTLDKLNSRKKTKKKTDEAAKKCDDKQTKTKEIPVLTDRVSSSKFDQMEGTQVLEDNSFRCWANKANPDIFPGFNLNSDTNSSINSQRQSTDNLDTGDSTRHRCSASNERHTRHTLSASETQFSNVSCCAMDANTPSSANVETLHDNNVSTPCAIMPSAMKPSGNVPVYDSPKNKATNTKELSLHQFIKKVGSTRTTEGLEQYIVYNRTPVWNEASQVYQLDFGGRVTQESAKNFQIEWNDEQVMQFGRVDCNTYTMDFQYPFSAIQAFAVALANITQRLK